MKAGNHLVKRSLGEGVASSRSVGGPALVVYFFGEVTHIFFAISTDAAGIFVDAET